MDPFIAQIIMFGGNFAPRGWALCNGQLLAINQYTALFSILGTTYGGDGRTTFGLPDLRGRVAMHAGNGPGLTPKPLGQKAGSETNTISVNQMPSHNHQIGVKNSQWDDSDPTTANGLGIASNDLYLENYPAGTSLGKTIGGGQPVNNMPPYQTVNYIIALVGVFPSRN